MATEPTTVSMLATRMITDHKLSSGAFDNTPRVNPAMSQERVYASHLLYNNVANGMNIGVHLDRTDLHKSPSLISETACECNLGSG